QRLVDVACVELVVAGHEEHRLRPVGEQAEPLPGAVDVAGQHEQIGAGGGPGREILGFEMEVGQQLDLHDAVWWRGRVTSKVVRALDSTSTVPPCAITMWRTMYRPSPNPSCLSGGRSPPRKGSKRC